MELKDLFYKWVPVWVKLPVLFIFFFVVLTANGVYLGNSTDMYSGLGVYSEPFTAAYNAVYIGMGLGLMVEVRLKRRFSSKTLLLWGFAMMLFVWSKKLDTSRLYPFVYGLALGGIYFITWFTASLAGVYNWRYAYLAM